MNLYIEILQLTEKVEEALLNENLSAGLTGLIEARTALFTQLQTGENQMKSNDREIITQIQECEARCVEIAQEKKTLLKKEIKNTRTTKRCHAAYGRQMASVY